MYCYKCGSVLRDNANFCSVCGSAVSNNNSPPQSRSVYGTVQLRCKACGGTLVGNVNTPILSCPFCHASEILVESDVVATQRLKSNENITIALDKTNTIRQMANDDRDFEREKRNTLSAKGKVTLVAAIATIVLIVICIILIKVNRKEYWGLSYIIYVVLFAWMLYGSSQINSNKNE